MTEKETKTLQTHEVIIKDLLARIKILEDIVIGSGRVGGNDE